MNLSALKALKEYNCPEEVINHSEAVTLKAMDISKNLSENYNLNLEIVEKGAILHDIGRCMTDGIYHAVVGAHLLKLENYPPEIIKIVERHIGAGIPKKEAISLGLPAKDFMPLTLEEKIVAHADNLLHGIKEVNIDFVVDKWSARMGFDHPSIARLREMHKNIVLDHY